MQNEPIPLPGQAGTSERKFEWDWSGYFEDTFNTEYLKQTQRGAVLNAAGGRLNFSGKYRSRFDIGLSVVGIVYSGRKALDTVPYFPEALQSRILRPDPDMSFPGARELFEYKIDNRLYFQEAFGTLYWKDLWLRVGRHKFYSGTGCAFNPVGLFNRKDAFDPMYEIDGLDAVILSSDGLDGNLPQYHRQRQRPERHHQPLVGVRSPSGCQAHRDAVPPAR